MTSSILAASDKFIAGEDKLEKDAPRHAQFTEIQALKAKLATTAEEIHQKKSNLTVQDLKRLLFRSTATLISIDKVSHLSVNLFHSLI